ncbi:hypothetical protein Acid345_4455 [Candidatus Koribacter versatilis Ellin345]|uniref:DinB-like domain-containing protein n=1 Tax=Koribacter versatilis (strain Ellin345) TaxID=204669 RepID=Q1II45_KORVE|nr:DinB family protein [Candidatus Koribacter versatilis]ABF43455.1 hypothetical protein Acid345_4455 [Candidatus Koribacter versatilis Ellin345]
MSATLQSTSDIAVLRGQNRTTQFAVKVNTEGISHAESLVSPASGGNNINWVVGHLVCVYNNVLPAVGQPTVLDYDKVKRYDRGSKPITAADAIEFATLLAGFDEAVVRFETGLGALTPEQLDEKAPFSPANNPDETVRSLMSLVAFHQAYHSGQLGVLRRVIGKPAAFK